LASLLHSKRPVKVEDSLSIVEGNSEERKAEKKKKGSGTWRRVDEGSYLNKDTSTSFQLHADRFCVFDFFFFSSLISH
jgi:hypothetical protein